MSVQPTIRPTVSDARQRLSDGRQQLRNAHREGMSGDEVCREMTVLVDDLVRQLYADGIDEVAGDDREEFEERVALVLHGGSGRREMAPFSDVDLMLLHEGAELDSVVRLARRITQDVFDIGLQLGLSTRTPRQTFQLVPRDATIYTSLCESRLLLGSQDLYDRYWQRFQQTSKRRTHFLIDAIEKARREERLKYGETVFLLRPNVKRSRGALRDIQLVRWIAMTRFGARELNEMLEIEALAEADYQALAEAREFLLRLRNELHFSSGKAQDVLNRRDQVRIAEIFGYAADEGVLPVERFMSDYFRHTGDVRYSSAHFIASARTRSRLGSIVGPMFSLSYEGDFRVGPIQVGCTNKGLEKVTKNLVDVLRLMELSNAFNRRIDHPTWQAIRESMMQKSSIDLTPDAAKRFVSLLGEPTRLADLLRRLHEMSVLEKILPAFEHARALLQFNEYHKYTVDEHSIRAVDLATRFINDDTTLGECYRSINQKSLLHLAILLHDAGKGFKEDHSELGQRIAEESARRLGLSEDEIDIVKFLVHRHLLMSHLALRRNLDDDTVIAEFASEVGSVEVLKMLYVLTCADLGAVGPDVLNDWKLSLLSEMYQRTKEQLAGEYAGAQLSSFVLDAIDFASDWCEDPADAAWLDDAIRKLPSSIASSITKQSLCKRLLQAKRLASDGVKLWSKYVEESKSVDFTIAIHDRPQSGYFHKFTGALTSAGTEILTADVTPLGPTLTILRFQVHDLDHEDAPPESRLKQLKRELQKVAAANSYKPPTFRTVWKSGEGESSPMVNRLPSRVRVDNDSVERFTLIDVFANDRIGLLYNVARALYELHLEIRIAKIGTYLDQVVDVFYVTDLDGGKVKSPDRVRQIRDTILKTLTTEDENASTDDENAST